MARRRRPSSRRGPKKRISKKRFRAVCSSCGKELIVEVAPPPDKELLCLECFNK